MSDRETMAEARTEGGRAEEDEGRVITIKLDLRGPMELFSWVNPFKAGGRFVGMLPPGAREHMVNAQKEQLLAVRSIVDSVLDGMIDRVVRYQERSAGRKATKVEVE